MDPVTTIGLLALPVAVAGIVASIIGLAVEHRRRWPHGRGRTCNNPLCACWRTATARLTKNGTLL